MKEGKRLIDMHELWVLDDRPDLKADCAEFVLDNDYLPVHQAVINFLSSHCHEAISSQDLDKMAYEDWKRMADSFEDYLKEQD